MLGLSLPDSFWILYFKGMHHIYITLRKCLFNFFTQLWKSNIFIITNFSCKRLEAMTTLCVINDRASKIYILVTMFLLISSYQTNRMEISFTHSTCYGVEFKKCHANCDRQDRTLAVLLVTKHSADNPMWWRRDTRHSFCSPKLLQSSDWSEGQLPSQAPTHIKHQEIKENPI